MGWPKCRPCCSPRRTQRRILRPAPGLKRLRRGRGGMVVFSRGDRFRNVTSAFQVLRKVMEVAPSQLGIGSVTETRHRHSIFLWLPFRPPDFGLLETGIRRNSKLHHLAFTATRDSGRSNCSSPPLASRPVIRFPEVPGPSLLRREDPDAPTARLHSGQRPLELVRGGLRPRQKRRHPAATIAPS